jgi:hypothetical protein
MEDIYKTIVEVLQKGERASLATVIARKGSTPACIGFKMLVLSVGAVLSQKYATLPLKSWNQAYQDFLHLI